MLLLCILCCLFLVRLIKPLNCEETEQYKKTDLRDESTLISVKVSDGYLLSVSRLI